MVKSPVVKKIYSKNADWQKLIVLRTNRNKRYRYGEFLVEGVRNINGAINNSWEIVSFIYSPEMKLSDWAKNIISSTKYDIKYELSAELMTELSAKSDTSEIMATVRMKYPKSLPEPKDHAPLYMLFDRPSNRGNLGTVIRSCDGFGCDGLIICGHGVDLYEICTDLATLPMAENSYASSFNAACAATVMIYEAMRQRRS